jgi:Ser/Thr protein kinase RdoA (MazF antagonist)
MTELFLRLTPDWVLRAVEAGGFEPTGHISALHCLENRVYDLKLEDESHVVVKFYRPGRWTREQILEEHQFLNDLRDGEIPVCAPLAFEDGKTVHEVEGIYYAVWPRTGGRSPSELTDEQVEILGRLLARIHNTGAAKKPKHRLALTDKTYALEPLEFLISKGFLPPQFERRFRDAVEKIAEIHRERSKGVPVHRIHGDCHHGNLLFGREGWFFLDFDDYVTGPAVQDVWLLVPARDEEGVRQRRLMIEAYRTFRPFENRWISLVETLRALRFIHYAAWIARRWKDPAFPAHFPNFNTEDYWQRETVDLEDQLRKITED